VAPGGYAWWYLDALSDDGAHGLTIIAFVGSVFSPYYASARRRAEDGLADAHAHCAMNIALYGRAGHRWSMTERGRDQVRRDASRLRIGPSTVERHGATLVYGLDEVTAPWPSRLHGIVRVHAPHWYDESLPLDAAGRHQWRPLAPCARVDVQLSAPALQWSGPAYVDHNHGAVPLEKDFLGWHWSRARLSDDSAAVVYDVQRRDGSTLAIARHFDAGGRASAFDAPAVAALPSSAWRVQRRCRSDAGSAAQLLQSFEDGPFYARSLIGARWAGEPVRAIHESLSLARFRKRWVQALLPFRMPRWAR
jgi:carotenoid 1,2-hydratase